jgi:hypothetical protein
MQVESKAGSFAFCGKGPHEGEHSFFPDKEPVSEAEKVRRRFPRLDFLLTLMRSMRTYGMMVVST